MGVYIPNMEMPQVCVTDDGWYGNCPMDRVWCAMRFKPEYEEGQWLIDEITGKLPAWCPLRPLPEKHGRLIDADDMERFMSDTVQGDIRQYPYSDTLWDMAFKWIDSRPTIVEAEGDG